MSRFAVFLIIAMSTTAFGEQRMISIGDRRVSVDCEGESARSPTVILIPAGGSTAKDWALVQPAVAHFYVVGWVTGETRRVRLQVRLSRSTAARSADRQHSPVSPDWCT